MKYHVAIDAGACYIKIIEGYENNDQLFVKKIGYFPNPFTGLRNNLVEREQDVFVKALRQFLHKHGIREKRTVSNISGAGAIIHYFDIPNLPEDEIKSAVQLELMQVTPGGTKNMEYDYLILPGKNGRKTVLFVGYQKDKCKFFTDALHGSGLKPLIMDHDSLAVFNCFNFLNKQHNGPIFVLNIGHKTTNFVLAQGKNGFILIRDIPFGGKNLTASIAAGRGISAAEAEIYRSKKENADEVRKIIETNLEELLAEVKIGMEYFKSRTEKPAETLFLTGGTSVLPGVCETFEKNIEIKVSLWNPLEQIVNKKMLVIPEDLRKNGMIFAVSLGLILRKIK